MSRKHRNMEHYYAGWGGIPAHPQSPAGGGGPGSFSHAGTLNHVADGYGVPHPNSPVGRTSTVCQMPGAKLIERAECVYVAIERAKLYAPGAILHETGRTIQQFTGGLLSTVVLSLGVIATTTTIGAAAGAAVGALAGGVGAIPGAAVGAASGLDIGLFLLDLLGLGFLFVYIKDNLQQVTHLASSAIRQAWHAPDSKDGSDRLVDTAAHDLARSVGIFFQLILQAVVAFALAKGAEEAAGRMPELSQKLRESRLGASFATWIEENRKSLMEDARLRPKTRRSAVRSAASSAADPPSPLRPTHSDLYNKQWKTRQGQFRPKPPTGPVDMDNLSAQQTANRILDGQGRDPGKVKEILKSGHEYKPRKFEKGEKLYGFVSSDGAGKQPNNPYWVDEGQYQKLVKDGKWDRWEVKNALALPCSNRADKLVVGEVTEAHEGIVSTISPAKENVTYVGDNGMLWPVDQTLPGGGTQVTPGLGKIRIIP